MNISYPGAAGIQQSYPNFAVASIRLEPEHEVHWFDTVSLVRSPIQKKRKKSS